MLINESNEKPKMDAYMKINFSKWKTGVNTERQTYLDNYVTMVKKKKKNNQHTPREKTHPVEVGELKNLNERNSNREFN